MAQGSFAPHPHRPLQPTKNPIRLSNPIVHRRLPDDQRTMAGFSLAAFAAAAATSDGSSALTGWLQPANAAMPNAPIIIHTLRLTLHFFQRLMLPFVKVRPCPGLPRGWGAPYIGPGRWPKAPVFAASGDQRPSARGGFA